MPIMGSSGRGDVSDPLGIAESTLATTRLGVASIARPTMPEPRAAEFFARCRDPEPCDFEVLCDSAVDQQRIETAHLQRWHADSPPATDDLCQQVFEQHANESEVVIQAIEYVARRFGGRVDPNEVRPLIAPGITPQVIGSVYRVLRKRGRLTVDGENVNNDTRGRNAGKKQPVYRLVDADDTHGRRSA